MKKVSLVVAVVCAMVGFTGCMSTNTNDAAVVAPAKVLEKEFKSDIVTKEAKVSGEANINCLFGFIIWGASSFADDAFVETSTSPFPIRFANPMTLVKQAATYEACKGAKADYILGAKYKVDTKDYFVFKQINCQVVGFPAELVGIKPVGLIEKLEK